MGAERDPAVRIVDYDPGWPAEAARELERVGGALGGLAVRLDHVGSTAVPGLAAKPIVDLQASVVTLEPQAAYVEPLEAIGYLFVPYATSPAAASGGPPRLHRGQGSVRPRAGAARPRVGPISTFLMRLQKSCNDSSQIPVRETP